MASFLTPPVQTSSLMRRHDVMRAGKNPTTGESEIYLSEDEAAQMKDMVQGANLPLRRVFHKLMSEI